MSKSLKDMLSAKKNAVKADEVVQDEVLSTVVEAVEEMQASVSESAAIVERAAEVISELEDKIVAQDEEIKRLKEASVEDEDKVEAEVKSITAAIREAIVSGRKNHTFINEGKIQNIKSTDGKIVGAIIPEFAKQIVDRIIETSSLVGLFDNMPVGNTEYQLPVTVGKTGAQLGAAYTVGNGDIKWNKGSFCLGTAKPVLNDNQINDAFFPVLPWVQKQISEDFGTLFAEQVIAGNGTGEEMKGFLYFFDKTKTTDTARGTEYFNVVDLSAEVDYDRYALMDKLNEMVLDLPSKFKSGASWVMNRKNYLAIASLRDEVGQPLMQRSAQDANVMALHGYPVVLDLLLPEDAPVLFGDFKEAYSLLTLANSLTFKVNEWQQDGHTTFPSQFRAGGVVKSNKAVIGLAMPSSIKKGA
ncbi:phage major capsid protein [Aeromonas hydrophila]|uniref:phage major capsid protein n=1 Tax=Aeromonas hydrophila TaxID=644 RepID=UPI0002FF6B40|nr:phage major capsid protein [Aeromonas hydrophila]